MKPTKSPVAAVAAPVAAAAAARNGAKTPIVAAAAPKSRPKTPGASAASPAASTPRAEATATTPSATLEAEALDVGAFLDKITAVGRPSTGLGATVSEDEIMEVLHASRELFASQPMMLEIEPPVCFVGDIHGQFTDLIRIFDKVGFERENWLFLGDYIDRGHMNLETILLLLALRLKWPLNCHLLRGNHETEMINKIYGFYEELNRRYRSPRLYAAFQDVFNVMPLSALVGDRILAMHGGLSPELYDAANLDVLKKISRPLAQPAVPSLPLDLLWADPCAKTEKFKTSIRGVSCTFGVAVINHICNKFHLDLIVRAHQVVQDGYEFFANRKSDICVPPTTLALHARACIRCSKMCQQYVLVAYRRVNKADQRL